MSNTTFERDDAFSKRCQDTGAFDAYYKSDEFKAVLQKLRKRGDVSIVKIEKKGYSENHLFQAQSHLDLIIELNCGTTLNIDEKAESIYEGSPESWYDNFAIELVSNPNAGYAHDGWAYHEGTVVVKMKFLVKPDDVERKPIKQVGRPCVFRCGRLLVDDVQKNPSRYIPNKKTNGLYPSGYKWIARPDLEKHWY